MLELNISDVQEDIQDASDENLLNLTAQIAGDLSEATEITSEYLTKLSSKYDVTEINCKLSELFIYTTN